MQFDELCALVGALRDRVADLEAKEARRAERDARTVVIESGVGRDWRTMGGKPLYAATPKISLDLTGADGNAEIAEIAEAAVRRGLAAITVADRNRLS